MATVQEMILAEALHLGWQDNTKLSDILHLNYGGDDSLWLVVDATNGRIRHAHMHRPDGSFKEVRYSHRDKLTTILGWLAEVSRCDDCATRAVREAGR
jgi:hypothetical protein